LDQPMYRGWLLCL